MTADAQARRRWLWPQRVRTRLTLTYAVLFLAGGLVLLGLTYGLVAASLPTATGSRPVLSRKEFIQLCKQPQPAPASNTKPTARTPGVRPHEAGPSPRPVPVRSKFGGGPNPNRKIEALCGRAFTAGSTAGSTAQRARALRSLLMYSLLGLAAMTLASGAAGWILADRVLRPVRVITDTARRASEQHLGERIGLTGAHDELRELADTFDAMLERLDRAFAAQRRFVADASHELRTPLTVMRTAIDVTLAKPARTPEQLEAMAGRVRRSIDQAESMIGALLTLATTDQAGPADHEPVDLATAVEDALDVARAQISALDLTVTADLQPAETTGSASLLERLVGNLVDNSVRHNVPEGWIRIQTGARGEHAFLEIANSGQEVPEEAVDGLFEPFQKLAGRTASGEGAGLGLAIVRSIAAAHGTVITARSQLEGGLTFSIRLPRREQADD